MPEKYINSVVNSTYYHGKKHKFVTQDVQNDVMIGRGESLVFDVPVDFIKYEARARLYEARAPDNFNSMRCKVVVKCSDTQKSICDSFDFNMPNQKEIPHIQVFHHLKFFDFFFRNCLETLIKLIINFS